LGILQAISTAAPFLGLAGTSYGILAEFSGWGISRGSAILYLLMATPSTLLTAAAGMLVAIPAVLIHNVLRNRVERMQRELSVTVAIEDPVERSFRRAQTLPLKRRFSGLPPYALIAAPVFAIVVIVYMLFKPYKLPKGLPVRLPSFPCQPDVLSDRIIVLRVTKSGELFINAEPVRWTDLRSRLSAIYSTRSRRELYLRAEDGIPFQTVADAIDVARKSTGVAGSADVLVFLITPQVEAESEKCFAIGVDRLGRQSLRK
jgi:biopolymer transport protein ExbD